MGPGADLNPSVYLMNKSEQSEHKTQGKKTRRNTHKHNKTKTQRYAKHKNRIKPKQELQENLNYETKHKT